MERPADEGTVVQTVPMLRVQAVILTLLALVALAVTAVLAKNPLDAVVSSVIGAIIWAAVMHFLVTRRAYNLPPVRVSPEGLPPIDSAWKWVLPHTTLVTVFYIASGTCRWMIATTPRT